MAKKIEDSVVVITGASSGIGRATALRLAGLGAKLVLAARNEDALKAVERECRRRGAKALAVRTDVTSEGDVQNLARQAAAYFGRIDVWVNNAGVILFGRLEDTPPRAFRQVIETNLFGYINGARTVLPYFRQQGRGTLINVSSVHGKVGVPFSSAYAASKFAVNGLTESLRMELRNTPGIQVCTILPASVDTPLFQHAANYVGRAAQPIPPVYTPDSVARAIERSIESPRPERFVGASGRQIVAMRRTMPRRTQNFYARKVEQSHFQKRAQEPVEGNLFIPGRQLMTVRGGWHGHDTRRSAWLLAPLALVLAYVTMRASKKSDRQPEPVQPVSATA